MKHDSVRMPAIACPHCGHKLDATRGVLDKAAKPKPGDWGMCIECLGFFVFADKGGVRRPARADLAGLAPTQRKLIERMWSTTLHVKVERYLEQFKPPSRWMN